MVAFWTYLCTLSVSKLQISYLMRNIQVLWIISYFQKFKFCMGYLLYCITSIVSYKCSVNYSYKLCACLKISYLQVVVDDFFKIQCIVMFSNVWCYLKLKIQFFGLNLKNYGVSIVIFWLIDLILHFSCFHLIHYLNKYLVSLGI